jgi:dethiobiotin synthetase
MTATFVTGTGTDIGKTFVTAGLIRFLRAAGRAVTAIKPVVTGFDSDNAGDSDPGVLLAALGLEVTADQIDRISPFRFAAPLSPDMAARKESRTIDFDVLVEFCRRAIIGHTGAILIEGVGGVMVPLDERRTVLDWMAALGRPAVVVTGSYLGSLSHTLTCLEVLQRRDIPIKVLIVNETAGSTVPVADTVATLRSFARTVPVVTMPHRPAGATELVAFNAIAELL